VQFGTPSDLIARLTYSFDEVNGRPLAFLTGAGLSVPSVPGVTDTLTILRRGLPPEEQIELDRLLAAFEEPGEKYRQAFQFLGLRRPPKFAERVLKLATLRAYDHGGLTNQEILGLGGETESKVDRWKLPTGQAALGRILTGLPPTLLGPVLTTNFDPLTEVAVRRAGGTATTYIHADDSSFVANVRVQIGVGVVHLHGFWRDSPVLNTADELLQDRNSLAAALRVILERHTLLVIGYGGWSDVVTRTLLQVVNDNRSEDLDVLWAVHRDARQLESTASGAALVKGFSSAPSNVHFYAGVDAGELMSALELQLAPTLEYVDSARRSVPSATLIGWSTVTAETLEVARTVATDESAVSFFDGRLPAWHDSVNPNIPTRDMTVTIASEVAAAFLTGASTFTVLTGASGEGKSMIALQAGAAIALGLTTFDTSDLKILSLESEHFGTASAMLELPRENQYLLIIDEAHRFVGRLQEVARLIQESGRTGIHLLAVSRDTDWTSSGGSNFAWSRFLRTNTHIVQGVSHVDASAMIAAWERLGPAALGELGSIEASQDRVEALIDASLGEGIQGPGTLLGALLTTRYDRAGLRAHIRDLMENLGDRLIPGGRRSLLDALVSIAIPHAYGVLSLGSNVLASSLELSRVELNAYVLHPLGEEAAITFASGRIVTRHELIASAILDVCLEIDYDLSARVRAVVGSAALRIRHSGYDGDLAKIAYLGTRIVDLPRLALVAAEAACDAVPDRLSYRTTLSSVMRRSQLATEATQVAEDAIPLFALAENAGGVRSHLTEWGVAEGSVGNFARNAVLVGLSLQDGAALGQLRLETTALGASCLLLALRRLHEAIPDSALVDGLAALSVVIRELEGNFVNEWVRAAERIVERAQVNFPRLQDGIKIEADIVRALRTAAERLESPLPANLPRQAFQFSELRRISVDRSVLWH
jgi:hypothetical protein